MAMAKKTDKVKILVFLDINRTSNADCLEGIYSMSRKEGWLVATYYTDISRREARRIAALAKPDGIIADGNWGGQARNVLDEVFAGMPLVVRNPQSAYAKYWVGVDSTMVAALAAEEVLGAEPATLIFATAFAESRWSGEREERARSAAAEKGIAFRTLDLRAAKSAKAVAVLAEAARPLGIFAANDKSALLLYPLIEKAGLEFGEDVVVAGADNDTLICENLSPKLTSVAFDSYGEGRAAARLLGQAMTGGGPASVRIPPKGIVRRSSSIPALANRPLARRALAAISDLALDGLSVASVAKACGVSRRTLETAFKAAVGKTVHEVIADVRFGRVEQMLLDRRQAIVPIASFCGWKSPEHLARAFKKRYGMTMREWRLSGQRP